MTPTRVVHYNHTGAIAGAEGVLLTALYHLRHGASPQAVSPQAGPLHSILLSPAGPLQAEAQHMGLETAECYALQARFTTNPLRLGRYAASLVRSVRALRGRFQELAPDVVHANSVRAGLVATLATVGMGGTPVVWHVHDTLPRHPLSWAIRLLARMSDRTSQIAVSQATASTFAGLVWKHRLAAKTAVLHNAIDPLIEQIGPEHRAALRRELSGALDGEGKVLIGCIGQICARKNQIGMVEMFQEVLAHEPQARLVIVGTALFPQNEAYERALRARVEELGLTEQVLLLGKRNDVPALLQTLDMLVLPSHSEPFAMILLEAAAHGLPIVAFRVDGVPELIADRRTGWLVPAGDALQMSRTLVWAARHPEQRRRLGEAAREDLQHRQTPEDFALHLAALLEQRRNPNSADVTRDFDGQQEEQTRLGDAA